MSILREFRQFILRGNVIDLAVGVVIGAAFNGVVTSLVSDILTPVIGAVAKIPDFDGLSLTIHGSHINYGHFLNVTISFILVAGAIFFFVIKPMNILVARFKGAPPPPRLVSKKCPQCLSDIPLEAKRCAHCTQVVE